jgi:hypothetical protein
LFVVFGNLFIDYPFTEGCLFFEAFKMVDGFSESCGSFEISGGLRIGFLEGKKVGKSKIEVGISADEIQVYFVWLD